jgi:Flp pilus assembly protein TadB
MDVRLLGLFTIPLLFGCLAFRQARRDRRKQLIESQLDSFASSASPPQISLTRLREQAATFLMLPQRLRTALDSAFEATGNSVRLLHLPIIALIAMVVTFAFTTRVMALNPVLVMLACAIAAVVSPIVLLWLAKSRYQRKFSDIFPDALDLIGRAVKAGLPVNEALLIAGKETADPVGSELRRAFDQVQIGVQMIEALDRTANRVQVADFRFLVVALALQQRTGGSLAETLKNLSTVIRARKALRLKARALSAEAKVSAFILAVLPFVVGGLLYVMNHDLGRLLIADSRGRFMVGLAFLSLMIGLSIMVVMVKRALR